LARPSASERAVLYTMSESSESRGIDIIYFIRENYEDAEITEWNEVE
jgi:hypothetical protein